MKKYTYNYFESILDAGKETPIISTTWESDTLDDWQTLLELFRRLEVLPTYSGWANTIKDEFGIARDLGDGKEELRGIRLTENKA